MKSWQRLHWLEKVNVIIFISFIKYLFVQSVSQSAKKKTYVLENCHSFFGAHKAKTPKAVRMKHFHWLL